MALLKGDEHDDESSYLQGRRGKRRIFCDVEFNCTVDKLDNALRLISTDVLCAL